MSHLEDHIIIKMNTNNAIWARFVIQKSYKSGLTFPIHNCDDLNGMAKHDVKKRDSARAKWARTTM